MVKSLLSDKALEVLKSLGWGGKETKTIHPSIRRKLIDLDFAKDTWNAFTGKSVMFITPAGKAFWRADFESKGGF